MKRRERERTGHGPFLEELLGKLVRLDMGNVIVTLSSYFDLCKQAVQKKHKDYIQHRRKTQVVARFLGRFEENSQSE